MFLKSMWIQSDIEWISPNTLTMVCFYRQRFEDLDAAQAVRPLLDLVQATRLSSGFLVHRSHCSAPQLGDPPLLSYWVRISPTERVQP